jgi:hypothetical protein
MHDERVPVTADAGNVGSPIVDLAVQGGADEVIALDKFVGRGYENLICGARQRARLGVEGDIRDRVLVAAFSASVAGQPSSYRLARATIRAVTTLSAELL